MGKLSSELIDEIEEICLKINNSTTSSIEKEILYARLREIYTQYFIELPNKDVQMKDS